MALFFIFILLCLAIGFLATIVFGMFFLLVIALLTTSGILATSVLVGLYKNSLKSGFNTALLLAVLASAISICSGVGFLLAWFYHSSMMESILIGAGVGLIIGLPAYYIIKQLIRIVLNLFDIKY